MSPATSPTLGVQASGHVMSIPMPGHAVPPAQQEKVQQDIRKLDEMVEVRQPRHQVASESGQCCECCEHELWRCQAHDVVFQLTDTRESRWLPTVLAAVHRKLTINVALGFDTYLAMRHGIPPAAGAAP